MARIPKTITLANAETQTVTYDTAADSFELTVGARDPVVWSKEDLRKTFEVIQSMRRIGYEWSVLQDIPTS